MQCQQRRAVDLNLSGALEMQDVSSVYPAACISVQKIALTPELQLSARDVRLCHP